MTMPRWVFTLALTTLAVAFSAAPARAGWFSSHGQDDCAPTCGVPADCCPQPACAAPAQCYTPPTCCAPAAPECCAPAACAPSYDACGEIYCDGSQSCERDGCFRRCVRRLWNLEQRKNRCLKETFCGWRNRGYDDCSDCAPLEYYQPACGAPCGCH
jgi:hypothetical protein